MAKKSEEDKKGLKLNIQNKQIAKAVNFKGIKEKLSKKKASDTKEPAPKKPAKTKSPKDEQAPPVDEAPRIKARSKSAFSEESGRPEEQTQKPVKKTAPKTEETVKEETAQKPSKEPEKLGPTGRHITDILPPKKPKVKETSPSKEDDKSKTKPKFKESTPPRDDKDDSKKHAGKKGSKFREFRDMKSRPFDARDKAGLRAGEDSYHYRKKRKKSSKHVDEESIIRPSVLTVRLPISVKDLASEMKRKASELIGQLFKHGMVVTINDVLDDETTIQLLGEDLGCKIKVDTSEEERIRITDKTVQEEINQSPADDLEDRAPVVTFMGHVDHGKTSLIDKIRQSDIVSGEAGAITQHIGAFLCHTERGGEIAILDTPGHEAFTAMRHRGANVTDIVVLVIAGDEGFRQQTEEALQQARDSGVSIVVALNKCDKPGFDADKIYRQLSEHELLPEAWGGQTVTVNCSALTGEGIDDLIEMLALQAEVLELKANRKFRARGTVLESEMHKGMGAVATVLVLNGTLKQGDPIVVDRYYGRIKTMRDEHGQELTEAGPSTPVEITGLSGIPEAGTEFIVVQSEKEARNISSARQLEIRQKQLQRRAPSLEDLMEEAKKAEKKDFNLMISADVQGSLEAVENALRKIRSEKVNLNIISTDIGEISESNIERASASNATILGFHTAIESHADTLLKQFGVKVIMHDIIYHAIDDVKELMRQTLDKIPIENERGTAEVRQTFRASQLGVIAGCYVTDGTIHRNHNVRVKRGGEEIWKGSISSLKRVKEDVREVQKGLECGILLNGFNDAEAGDIIEAFDISYIEQEL